MSNNSVERARLALVDVKTILSDAFRLINKGSQSLRSLQLEATSLLDTLARTSGISLSDDEVLSIESLRRLPVGEAMVGAS